MEIKIEKKVVVAADGGFESHPESYTPRVFVGVRPDFNSADDPKVYEILMNGQAIPWPCLPILKGFDYWVLYVDHLSDVDMHRAPKCPHINMAGHEYETRCMDCGERWPNNLHRAYTTVGPEIAMPQADGFSESGNQIDLSEGSH